MGGGGGEVGGGHWGRDPAEWGNNTHTPSPTPAEAGWKPGALWRDAPTGLRTWEEETRDTEQLLSAAFFKVSNYLIMGKKKVNVTGYGDIAAVCNRWLQSQKLLLGPPRMALRKFG